MAKRTIPNPSNRAYTRFLKAFTQLEKALGSTVSQAAREYYRSQARVLDEAAREAARNIAARIDEHGKAGTHPSGTELLKWSATLWNL